MNRSGLVLIGALLWFAWHVGTLSVPTKTSGLDAHDSYRLRQSVDSGQPTLAAPQVGLGLQHFALESGQFLGHTAHTVRDDSILFWDRLHPAMAGQANVSRSDWTASSNVVSPPFQAQPQAHPAVSIASFQAGLAMAWKQAQPVMAGLQPVAQSGWRAVQTGWHQLMAGAAKEEDQAIADEQTDHSTENAPRRTYRR